MKGGGTKMKQLKITVEKTIVVKWIPEERYGYGKALRVTKSDHPRFTKGSRFDFGFFITTADEGYTIIFLPGKEESHEGV